MMNKISNRLKKIGLCLGCCMFVPYVFAGELGPYQLILDKELLGVEGRNPIPAAQAKVEPARPSWAQDYRLTMITQDGAGLRVGLQSLNDNSSYLLVEGESPELSKFQLLSGDYESGSALIRYQGTEHRFSFQGGSARVNTGIQEESVQTAVPPPIAVLRERRMVHRAKSSRSRP